MLTYNANIRGKTLEIEAKKAISHIEGFKEENVINGMNRLLEILEYNEKREYISILCIVPTYYLYNEEIEKVDKDIFYNRITKNIKNVEKRLKKSYVFLDYSHDKRFEDNIDYFMDDDHLNEKGAEYFTEILLEDAEKEIENERKI